MMLADMQSARRCRILSAPPDLQSRLYALGLYPGVVVDILRFAPLGDPVQVRVGGTLLSIRKREAAMISVEALP